MVWVRLKRTVLLLVLVIGSTSCGGDSGTSPAGPSLFVPQFTGDWAGTATLTGVTSVASGECVQPTLQGQVGTAAGTERVNLSISQDAQKLSARLSSASTGLSCSYTGTATLNAVALDTATCDAPVLIVRCADNSVRDLKLLGSTVQGTLDSGQLSGTVTNSYNVFVSGTTVGVTRITMSYQFVATKP